MLKKRPQPVTPPQGHLPFPLPRKLRFLRPCRFLRHLRASSPKSSYDLEVGANVLLFPAAAIEELAAQPQCLLSCRKLKIALFAHREGSLKYEKQAPLGIFPAKSGGNLKSIPRPALGISLLRAGRSGHVLIFEEADARFRTFPALASLRRSGWWVSANPPAGSDSARLLCTKLKIDW